jgi:hypothetical protein
VVGNPIRAGIAKEPWAYPWSSAGYHTGERGEDLLWMSEDCGIFQRVGRNDVTGKKDEDVNI